MGVAAFSEPPKFGEWETFFFILFTVCLLSTIGACIFRCRNNRSAEENVTPQRASESRAEEGEPSQWYAEENVTPQRAPEDFEREIEKRVRKVRRKMEKKMEKREAALVQKFGEKLQEAIMIYETENEKIAHKQG